MVSGRQPFPGGCALVTGASSGIGAAFVDALAQQGYDVVLVARSSEVLEAQAQQVARVHHVRARAYAVDLASEGGVRTLVDRLSADDVSVDLLVNNAGFATQGRFDTIEPDQDHRQAYLNVLAVVDLSHALIPPMVARGHGAVINVGSLGGFQPAPFLAVYGASKAFVLSFSQALAGELASSGVRVLALCPGPVMTPFFDKLGSTDAAVGQRLTPTAVVEQALRGLDRDARVVVPGWRNRATSNAARLLPRRLMVTLAQRSVGLGETDTR